MSDEKSGRNEFYKETSGGKLYDAGKGALRKKWDEPIKDPIIKFIRAVPETDKNSW